MFTVPWRYQVSNPSIDLTEELRHQTEFNRVLTQRLEEMFGAGLSPASPEDTNALVLLLVETIEARKCAEKQEKMLKAEVRRCVPEGAKLLDLSASLVLIDTRERCDLDREAIIRDFGQSFIEKYGKRTTYEVMTARAK
jgi:hypothetical protein